MFVYDSCLSVVFKLPCAHFTVVKVPRGPKAKAIREL